MRLMSFALTTAQLLDGTKTVTRRVGWAGLRPGDRLLAVRKAMGLRKGESPEVLAEVEVVTVRRERLDAITPADCAAEGFPDKTPEEFVAMFCAHMSIVDRAADTGYYAPSGRYVPDRRKVRPDDWVTRIEFRVVRLLAERTPAIAAAQVALPLTLAGT